MIGSKLDAEAADPPRGGVVEERPMWAEAVPGGSVDRMDSQDVGSEAATI